MLGATAFLDWWLATPSARDEDYTLYRQQLELLQHLERAGAGGAGAGGAGAGGAGAPPRAWLLKDPLHCFSFDALFGALPDAKVVWLHRAPEVSTASMCSLLAAVWSRMSRADPGPGGAAPGAWRALAVEPLARMVDAALAYRARAPRAAVLDVTMAALVAEPLATVERVYAFAGRELTPAARAAMEAYLARNKREKRSGAHKYALADFGCTDAEVAERFAVYKKRFGV